MNAARQRRLWLKLDLSAGLWGPLRKTQPRVSSSSRASPEKRPAAPDDARLPALFLRIEELKTAVTGIVRVLHHKFEAGEVVWHLYALMVRRAARNRQLGASWSPAGPWRFFQLCLTPSAISPNEASGGGRTPVLRARQHA